MKNHAKHELCLGLLLAPMLFLPACWQGNQKETTAEATTSAGVADGSPVLVSIDGRPAVTLNMLDAEFERLLDEQPNYRQILPFMPDLKKNFLQGMVSQEVVNEYITRNGIDRTAEYQKELEKAIEQVKRFLNTKLFSDRHPVDVSASEVRKFYDENKDKIPDFMESQGGVKAEAVSFDNEEDAKAFLAKAKETKDSLEKIATDAGYADNYHDYKFVNAQSVQVDPALKARIVAMSAPSVELYHVDNSWWVVKADEKQESKYVAFEKVKDQLEEYLKKQKRMEVFEKSIDTYTKQYNVEIHDELLAPAKEVEEVAYMEHQQDDSMQMIDVEPMVRAV